VRTIICEVTCPITLNQAVFVPIPAPYPLGGGVGGGVINGSSGTTLFQDGRVDTGFPSRIADGVVVSSNDTGTSANALVYRYDAFATVVVGGDAAITDSGLTASGGVCVLALLPVGGCLLNAASADQTSASDEVTLPYQNQYVKITISTADPGQPVTVTSSVPLLPPTP
jgi:hypothetical protein